MSSCCRAYLRAKGLPVRGKKDIPIMGKIKMYIIYTRKLFVA